VFSARTADTPQKFAIKVFDLNGSLEDSIGTPDEEVWLRRFDLEAKILKAVNHPGVITLHDQGCLDDGRPYLVMPFMAASLPIEIGRDVRDQHAMDRLAPRRRPKPLTPHRAGELIHQLVDALAAIHAIGVIHRDLKPGNILLTRKKSGRVKLCDFGMSRWSNQVFDVPGEMIGTKRYISPEQRRDPTTSDTRADIYSLGLVMYRMFTGKLPFDDSRSIAAEVDTVSDSWNNLIEMCVSPDPENRPENALALQRIVREM